MDKAEATQAQGFASGKHCVLRQMLYNVTYCALVFDPSSDTFLALVWNFNVKIIF